MKTPRILINLPKLAHNYRVILGHCDHHGINLTTVLKGIAGDLRIARFLAEAGLTDLGDSRIANLQHFQKLKARKMMLRLPALSELAKVVSYSDCSLHTEAEVLVRLDSFNQTHQVFLMVDLGDRREGLLHSELPKLAATCRKLRNIRAIGLGANFSCFAGVKPSVAKLRQLVELADYLKEEFQLPIEYVSGGNSSSLPLLYEQSIPPGINHLRIGEGILLGRETLSGNSLNDLYQEAFLVEAEVIQSQWKPDLPDGTVGLDAFGREPKLPVVGDGYRVLLNIGHQDTPLDGLKPLEPGIRVLGGSSDYLVCAADRQIKVGEKVRFLPNYWSLLGLMTAPYVSKVYLG